jgi:hypothetical protein
MVSTAVQRIRQNSLMHIARPQEILYIPIKLEYRVSLIVTLLSSCPVAPGFYAGLM